MTLLSGGKVFNQVLDTWVFDGLYRFVSSTRKTLGQSPIESPPAPHENFFHSIVFKLELVSVRLNQIVLNVDASVQPISAYFSNDVLLSELARCSLSPLKHEWPLQELSTTENRYTPKIFGLKRFGSKTHPPTDFLSALESVRTPTVSANVTSRRRLVLRIAELQLYVEPLQ